MARPHHAAGIPYEDLHIYYLEGHLLPNYAIQDDGFIGNWEEEGFSFLFFDTPADDLVDQTVHAQPQLTLLDKYNISYEQWLGEKPAPLEIGRFFIVPPWQQELVPEEKLPIIIDPGVVFGTGTHPTTRDCLSALDLAFRERAFATVLDIGTGTGLLAIAAARLGCRKILAVDLNHLAATTAKRNVALNRLEDRILVVRGRAEACSGKPADLVVANIHYDVMKHILEPVISSHGTYFVLSGLLRSQARALIEMPILRRAEMIRTWERDGIWHTFFGKTI